MATFAHKTTKISLMKKLFTLTHIIILMLLATFPLELFAGNDSNTVAVYLYKQYKDNTEEEDDEGNRIPARPVQCYISESTGIDIPAVDKSDITSFEVYSENGICLASLTEESEFVSFLFSLSEPVEIRIITDLYIYHGYISM